MSNYNDLPVVTPMQSTEEQLRVSTKVQNGQISVEMEISGNAAACVKVAEILANSFSQLSHQYSSSK